MFKRYLENEQFNLQINRFFGKFNDPQIQEYIENILPKLISTDAWYREWRKLAEESEANENFELAAAAYEAGDFYLGENDSNKLHMYNKYIENVYKYYKEVSFPIERFKISYENSFMPAIRMTFNKDYSKTLLVHGGYDGYMEELVPIMFLLKDSGYNLIIFDGPGQGGALVNGLKFIHNWEKPVSIVLDYFHLKEASLLGISWGGYLCMRAAAFEKRIKKVICYDIFYRGLDAIFISKELKPVEKMFANGEKDKVNAFVLSKMKVDIDTSWKFDKGMEKTGTKTPYDFLKAIQLHTLDGIENLIDQDVLLLAGEEDQYVPIEQMPILEKNLVNAKSITKKIFTRETGGEQHCQAGRVDLAYAEMNKFLTK